MKNIWKEGVMGVVIGDALGCPVQFMSREEIALNPVTGMRGHGTFDLPEGSWTDDSSLTLALLDSICRTGQLELKDIMANFVDWLDHGAFTPYDYSYDIGNGTYEAISAYKKKLSRGLPETPGSWYNQDSQTNSMITSHLSC